MIGSGKTQFCLHLTAQCCLMGLRSIYIDTEHTFSSIRLLNMIGGFDSKQEHLLELVRTETVFDCESLMNILTLIENELEEELNDDINNQYPVLLIIDSIAAPLRMSTMGYSRENILLLFTDCAKRLATRYNLLVLVTNQVTTKRRSNVLHENNNENLPLNTNKNTGNDFYMSVALGKAWSYSVNVRLAISYQGDTRRQLIVGKSIESPGYTIAFQILTDGLEEIEDHINLNTQRKSIEKQPIPQLIQADEMHLIGKQLRP
jgi:RecA/RadA recombinase